MPSMPRVPLIILWISSGITGNISLMAIALKLSVIRMNMNAHLRYGESIV